MTGVNSLSYESLNSKFSYENSYYAYMNSCDTGRDGVNRLCDVAMLRDLEQLDQLTLIRVNRRVNSLESTELNATR